MERYSIKIPNKNNIKELALTFELDANDMEDAKNKVKSHYILEEDKTDNLLDLDSNNWKIEKAIEE